MMLRMLEEHHAVWPSQKRLLHNVSPKTPTISNHSLSRTLYDVFWREGVVFCESACDDLSTACDIEIESGHELCTIKTNERSGKDVPAVSHARVC